MSNPLQRTASAKLYLIRFPDRIAPAYGMWNYFGATSGDSEDPANWLPYGDGDDITVPAGTGPMNLQAESIDTFAVNTGYNGTITLNSDFEAFGNTILNDVTIVLGGNLTFSDLGGTYTGNGVTYVSTTAPVKTINYDKDATIEKLETVRVEPGGGKIIVESTKTLKLKAGFWFVADELCDFNNRGTLQYIEDDAAVGISGLSEVLTHNYGTISLDSEAHAVYDILWNHAGASINGDGQNTIDCTESITHPQTLALASLISSGGTIALKGGSSVDADQAIYLADTSISFGDDASLTEAGGRYLVFLKGPSLQLVSSTMILGSADSNGKMRISHDGHTTFTDSTVESELSYFSDQIDSYHAAEITFSGSNSFALGLIDTIHDPPMAPWDYAVFEATGLGKIINNDFSSYLLPEGYDHRKTGDSKKLEVFLADDGGSGGSGGSGGFGLASTSDVAWEDTASVGGGHDPDVLLLSGIDLEPSTFTRKLGDDWFKGLGDESQGVEFVSGNSITPQRALRNTGAEESDIDPFHDKTFSINLDEEPGG